MTIKNRSLAAAQGLRPINSNRIAKGAIYRAGLALLLLLVVGSTAFGQSGRVNRYTVQTFSGSWSDLTSGATSVSVASNNDDASYTFSLPFAFNYDSTAYSAGTTMYFSTNGTLSFGIAPYTYNYSDPVGSTNATSAICPFSYDLVQNNNLFYYTTTGTSPNRVFTLEWYNFTSYGNSSYDNMEVKLYETTNVIEMLYSTHSQNMGLADGAYSAGVGLDGGTSPSFVYQRYGTASSTTTPSTDLRWTPPAPPIPPAFLSLSPHSINFGGVVAGVPVTATITASSVGPNTLHITGYGLSGAPDYTMLVAPRSGDSIQSGKSATYTVQFSPLTSGNRNATFTLNTDGKDSGNQSCTLTGIGVAPSVDFGATEMFHKVRNKLGSPPVVQYLKITSTGTGPLTINSIYLIGLNPTSYTVTRFPASPLAPGVTDSIGIGFQPKLEGRPDASLVIASNGFNKPFDTVTLWGVGILPHLVLTTGTGSNGQSGSNVTLRFDSVALGDSICQTVALQNTGTDTLALLKQLITSSDYDFSYYPLKGTDTLLLPDQTKLLNICFRPIKAGARVGQLRLYTNIRQTFESPSRDTSQFNISVSGTGVPFGRLRYDGAVADSVLVRTTGCMSGMFTNTGQVDFTVTSATVAGTFGPEYALTWTGGGPTFTLAPGQSKSVSICFTPVDRGPRPAVLNLTGTSSGEPANASVALAGFGLHICGTPTPGTLVDTVLLGASDQKSITVQNCGDVPTLDSAYFSTGSSTSFALNSAAVQGPIASGANATYTVLFSPTALGDVTGTLDFSPLGITSVILRGYGIGVLTTGTNTPASAGVGACVNDTIYFPNNGNIDWMPGAPTLSGADAANFTVISYTTTPVPAGGMAMVVLKFCPTKEGTANVSLDFPQSSPAPYQWTTYTTTATGMANGAVSERLSQDGFILGQSFPNPATTSAQVLVSLPKDASVNIDLLDATGSVVRNAFAGRLSTGDHTLSIDAKGLASGTYYYVLTSGDVRLTRELVLVK